ncbi:helix-turn-helix transcriptional regulator [Pseudanabaena minima]|uniref:helix-turn-helix transcriptional regulator n=1 Tax=Pseudanabaena minima TaxID=890415 RepID=UPI003DA990AF
MARFYPLEHEEWLKAVKQLHESEKDVLYYIRTLDPYSKGVKVNASKIAKDLDINRSTASRALKSLDAKGYIDLEILIANVSIKGKGLLHTRNDVAPTQQEEVLHPCNDVAPTQQELHPCNKQCADATSSASMQQATAESSAITESCDPKISKISLDLLERSDQDDFLNFENSEAAQSAVENSDISLDEAIAEIQKAISDNLEPDEIACEVQTPKDPINPIDGQFSRAAVENFVLKSLKSLPRDRKAYFSKFKPADWQKWELELRASVTPKRDPLAEDPWRLENSIAQAIADKNIDFARTKIENLRATHPDLAQQLKTKFFGGAA